MRRRCVSVQGRRPERVGRTRRDVDGGHVPRVGDVQRRRRPMGREIRDGHVRYVRKRRRVHRGRHGLANGLTPGLARHVPRRGRLADDSRAVRRSERPPLRRRHVRAPPGEGAEVHELRLRSPRGVDPTRQTMDARLFLRRRHGSRRFEPRVRRSRRTLIRLLRRQANRRGRDERH